MTVALANTAALFENVPWAYIGLGIGTVFVGLICIVILCKIIGLFCKGAEKTKEPVSVAAVPDKAERQRIIAAVTAVCAEHMGKDVKALRVVSFKKL